MAEGKMAELLGKTLQKNVGRKFVDVNTDHPVGLGDKEYVGLFFSGYWRPPGIEFTPEEDNFRNGVLYNSDRFFAPKLIKFYKKMRNRFGGNKFEVVFVSSDRDESSFKEYASEMPWMYLPYVDQDRKYELLLRDGPGLDGDGRSGDGRRDIVDSCGTIETNCCDGVVL
ncbi:uncharacterized protein [Argopecten irradians]|uniref:uncharacterized protein n=1 Tax=Argopecten irradians TaxID=31199 RepID=UPI00371291B3